LPTFFYPRLLGHETKTITRERSLRVSSFHVPDRHQGRMTSWRQSHLLGSRLEIPNIRFFRGWICRSARSRLFTVRWVGPSLPRSRYVGTGIARFVAPRRRTAAVPPRYASFSSVYLTPRNVMKPQVFTKFTAGPARPARSRLPVSYLDLLSSKDQYEGLCISCTERTTSAT